MLDYKFSYKKDSQYTGYAARNIQVNGNRMTYRLHRLIMERILCRPLLPTEQVDHINGDGLDNRRCNLRLATPQQNQGNSRKRSNNRSGFKGVWLHGNKYQAQIGVNYHTQYLGTFDTPEAAHEAYCKAAHELFGEFARES